MEEKVRQYLDRVNAESQRKEDHVRAFSDQRAKSERERELIYLGLCSREEAEKLPAPYEEGEWRWDAQKKVYYRYRAFDLSDEEYAEVCAARDRLRKANSEIERLHAPKRIGPFRVRGQKNGRAVKYLGGNKLAVVFRVCAWALFVLGLNLGILFGASSEPVLSITRGVTGKLEIAVREASADGGFNLMQMLFIWVAFFVLGMLFYATSEGLKLLQETRDSKPKDDPENHK